jgi:site-specific recombinase XerD
MASADIPRDREGGTSPPGVEIEYFLADLNRFLETVRGLSAGTRRKYSRFIRRFLVGWHSGEQIEWDKLSQTALRTFVSQELRSKKRPSNSACVALRAMLGFLNFKGVCPPGLADALPRIRRWRHATLPEILSGDQIEKMISATALSESGHRLRDRAIVVLLAKTGMRALEVTKLTLDDLDWRNGIVHIRDAKSRHDRDLPLTRDVGRAMLEYLKSERHPSEHRAVFLGAAPPYAPMSDSSTVSRIVRRALTKADIKPRRGAAHLCAMQPQRPC